MLEHQIEKLKAFLNEDTNELEMSMLRLKHVLDDIVILIVEALKKCDRNAQGLIEEDLNIIIEKLEALHPFLRDPSDLVSFNYNYVAFQASVEKIQGLLFHPNIIGDSLKKKLGCCFVIGTTLINIGITSYAAITSDESSNNVKYIAGSWALCIAGVVGALICGKRYPQKQELYNLMHKGALFFSNREKFDSLKEPQETQLTSLIVRRV